MRHLVHAVVREPVALGVRDEIVIFLLPAKRVWTGVVIARAVAPGKIDVKVKIAEADAAVARDGLVQQIDGVIDALVHRLDPARDDHLPSETPGLVDACERFELGDQLHGFLFRQKPARLHRVDQQLQLRQLKRARGKKIPAVPALDRHDIHAELLQARDVVIDALAFGFDAARGERIEDLRHTERVVFIRPPLKKLLEDEQLQFLV